MIKLTAGSGGVDHVMLFIVCARRFVDACAWRMAVVGRDAYIRVGALDRVDEQFDDHALGFVPCAGQGATGSVAMTTAAEQFGDARHVDLALRAQTGAIDARRSLL